MTNHSEFTRGFALVTEARNLWNNGNQAEAISVLHDALDFEQLEAPDKYSVAMTLAEMYVETDRFHMTLSFGPFINDVIKQVPEIAQPSAFARLSRALGKANTLARKYDAAVQNFDDAAETYALAGSDTGFADATVLKAMTLVRCGKYQDAIDTCRIVRRSCFSREKWTELNAIQALANAHLGNVDEANRLAGNNMTAFHRALGDEKHTSLVLTLIALATATKCDLHLMAQVWRDQSLNLNDIATV